MQFRTVKSVAADVLLFRWCRPLGFHIMYGKHMVNKGDLEQFRFHQQEILANHGSDWLAKVNKALGASQIFP